jgi:glycerophosphoryl diester phosphodiesterase
MRMLFFLSACWLFYSCQEIIEAPVPDLKWSEFDAADAKPLNSTEREKLEGVYTISIADDDFGKEAALKWSYVATKADTIYYLSFFCREDVRYFICEAKKKAGKLLLNGYWRNIENTKIGKAHFTAALDSNKQSLVLDGAYGMFDADPEKKIGFRYARPLNTANPYLLIAHRGGGRNNDLLPASENSVEMIRMASQLGANGIEIDVQLTKDGVPVLFHDANVNDRLTTKTGIHGAIKEYTWSELQNEVNLKRGGKVPTLKEALETVLAETPLRFVWLDCKYETVIPSVRKLQEEFLEKAKAAGRELNIVIGIPDEDVMKRFLELPGYKNVPSLCELDTTKAAQVDADYWAPSWVKGHQDEVVAAVQASGKKSLVWTVDIPDKIKEFMYEAKFNGIVTNRPTMAAYYYYARP